MKTIFPAFILALMVGTGIQAQPGGDIVLPEPDKTGGLPLMQALALRKSSREFTSRELPLQMLSDLLWATNGLNRPAEGKHTAPTARNFQDTEVYVILHDGLYIYEADANRLKLLKAGDFMKYSGKQDFVAEAALNLVFISDFSKLGDLPEADKLLYAGIHAGCMAQNTYLYCASAGLNTVTRRYMDIEKLSAVMELPPDRRIILAQTVGYRP